MPAFSFGIRHSQYCCRAPDVNAPADVIDQWPHTTLTNVQRPHWPPILYYFTWPQGRQCECVRQWSSCQRLSLCHYASCDSVCASWADRFIPNTQTVEASIEQWHGCLVIRCSYSRLRSNHSVNLSMYARPRVKYKCTVDPERGVQLL